MLLLEEVALFEDAFAELLTDLLLGESFFHWSEMAVLDCINNRLLLSGGVFHL